MQDMRAFYRSVYAAIGRYTPLVSDCGLLCGSTCCKGDRYDDTGMYLYPGESRLYRAQGDWYRVSRSNLTFRGSAVRLLQCDGHCPRDERPLACRVFPLMPYIPPGDGPPGVRIDPFARTICPLPPRGGINGLDARFVRAVRAATDLLCADARVRAYINEYSRLTDEWTIGSLL